MTPAAANDNKPGPDLQFCNAGSFVTCTAVTRRGWLWLDENLAGLDESPVCIEPRNLEDLFSARAPMA